MRQPLGIATGAAVAAIGALMLGEYEPAGATPYIAGLLFGLAVGEAITAVTRRSTLALAAVAAAEAAFGLTWAAWISAARHWEWIPGGAWAGVVIGAVAAGGWVRTAGRTRSRADTPPSPESPRSS